MYKIPLSGDNEQFNINILGNNYTIQVQYIGNPFNNWVFSIGNENGWLIQGFSIVFGINLNKPLSFLGLGFQIFLGCVGENTGLTQDNLGSKYGLYVVTNDQ